MSSSQDQGPYEAYAQQAKTSGSARFLGFVKRHPVSTTLVVAGLAAAALSVSVLTPVAGATLALSLQVGQLLALRADRAVEGKTGKTVVALLLAGVAAKAGLGIMHTLYDGWAENNLKTTMLRAADDVCMAPGDAVLLNNSIVVATDITTKQLVFEKGENERLTVPTEKLPENPVAREIHFLILSGRTNTFNFMYRKGPVEPVIVDQVQSPPREGAPSPLEGSCPQEGTTAFQPEAPTWLDRVFSAYVGP